MNKSTLILSKTVDSYSFYDPLCLIEIKLPIYFCLLNISTSLSHHKRLMRRRLTEMQQNVNPKKSFKRLKK